MIVFGDFHFGKMKASVVCADLAGFLSDMEKAEIVIEMANQHEEMTLFFSFSRRDYQKLRKLCDKKGYTLQITGRTGPYWTALAMLQRPVLLAGMLLLIFLSLWTPGRVFFVFVEGNNQTPTNLILEQAASCGISFGAERRLVRSENMKNVLLQRLPQLQWAGVNTYGCVAVISVTERMAEGQKPIKDGVYSIYANVDGVVREVTVTGGSAVCTVGQTVKAGDLLISGFTDCGLCIRAGRAKGEVFGETVRNISAELPTDYCARGVITGSRKKISLIIGKKRINFDKNSGILGGECVKIYTEEYGILPGGFRLPIVMVIEEFQYYEIQSFSLENPECILLPFMEAYLRTQMLAGRILTQDRTVTEEDGVYRIDGIYGCYEMIGVLRPEESLPEYENN